MNGSSYWVSTGFGGSLTLAACDNKVRKIALKVYNSLSTLAANGNRSDLEVGETCGGLALTGR